MLATKAKERRETGMKKLIGSTIAGASWLLLSGVALAQEGSDLNPPGGPQVGGVGGSVGGGSAFTGGEVIGLIVMAVALVAIGTVALVFARRRRAEVGA
jgi:hypothetical protein